MNTKRSKSIDKTYKLKPPQVGKRFSYSNVKFDVNGYSSTINALPLPYDMLTLQILGSNIQYPGWFTGTNFVIPRLKNKLYKVVAWKLQKFEDIS
jgi:hypothetical protein